MTTSMSVKERMSSPSHMRLDLSVEDATSNADAEGENVDNVLIKEELNDDDDADTAFEPELFSYTSYSCSFCALQHGDEVTILYHEILVHPKELEQVLESTDSIIQGEVSTRYFHTDSSNTSCKLCGTPYASGTTWALSHVKVHLIKRELECLYCIMTFPAKAPLNQHILYHERDEESRELAGNMLSAKILVRQQIYASDSDVPSDNEMGYSTSPNEEMDDLDVDEMPAENGVDTEVNHEPNMTSCSYCIFQDADELITLTHEVLLHAKELEQEIEKDDLKIKRRFFHRTGPGENKSCKLCGSKNLGSNHLMKHYIRNEFQCSSCTVTFDKVGTLKLHNFYHNKQKKADVRKYYLAKKFVEDQFVKGEIEASAKDQKDVVAGDEAAEYKCSYCIFQEADELITLTHEVLIHGKELEQEMQKDDKNLRLKIKKRFIHRIAPGENKSCKLCGSKNLRSNHLMQHFNKNEFQCSSCTVTFDKAATLKVHNLIHNKQKKADVRKYYLAKKFVEDQFIKRESEASAIDQKDVVAGDAAAEYKCSYCVFCHQDEIVTLTHEVLVHARKIIKGLDGKYIARTEIRKRFRDNVVKECKLCSKGTAESLNRSVIHIKKHVIKHEFPCLDCTFSCHNKMGASRHNLIHTSNQKAKVKRLKDAKTLVLKQLSSDKVKETSTNMDTIKQEDMKQTKLVIGKVKNNCRNPYSAENSPGHSSHSVALKPGHSSHSVALKPGQSSNSVAIKRKKLDSSNQNSKLQKLESTDLNKSIDACGQLSSTRKSFRKNVPGLEASKCIEPCLEMSDNFVSNVVEKAMPKTSVVTDKKEEPSLIDKCLFCDFSHAEEVYILTHEVLSHATVLTNCFGGDNALHLDHNRYVLNGIHCKLCGAQNKKDRLVPHLKLHLATGDGLNICSVCTYVITSQNSHGHQTMHKKQDRLFTDRLRNAKSYTLQGTSNSDKGRESKDEVVKPTFSTPEHESKMSAPVVRHANQGLASPSKTPYPMIIPVPITDPSYSFIMGRNSLMGQPFNLPFLPQITSPYSNPASSLPEDVMRCPMCSFLCNDRKLVIEHVKSHSIEETD